MERFRKNTMFQKVACLIVAVSFLTNFALPGYVRAEINLPAANQFVNLSNTYSFPVLKGVKFDPSDPFKMKFFIDTADQKSVSKDEAATLIKYFLAALTIPQDELWVNMSPYEKDRMITSALSETDLGKDMLSQDYILKQLSSSLTYPESETGKDFWGKTYQEVLKVAKTTKLPVNTFNKIWIIPDQAEVYENGNAAFVTEASLKTMLEEDYLALKQGLSPKGTVPVLQQQINKASSEVMRTTILPKINADVNSGKNFATLRQVYHSIILAVWFKEKFKNSLYRYYIDKGKLSGINLADKDAKDQIYNLYVEAFKKGIYNYIKPEKDLGTGRNIKRKYFSGGLGMTGLKVSKAGSRAKVADLSLVETDINAKPTTASSSIYYPEGARDGDRERDERDDARIAARNKAAGVEDGWLDSPDVLAEKARRRAIIRAQYYGSGTVDTSGSPLEDATKIYRKPVLGYNLKGKVLKADIDRILQGIAEDYKNNPVDPKDVDVVILPPHGFIQYTREKIDALVKAGLVPEGFIQLGVQDIRPQGLGEFTGYSPSIAEAVDLGATFALIGHSELSTDYLGDPRIVESDELLNDKYKAIIKDGRLRAIVAVGEKPDAYQAGKANEVIDQQLSSRLAGVSEEEMLRNDTIIAYEPVAAIGEKAVYEAKPSDAQAMTNHIRGWLLANRGFNAAANTVEQYGGSMKPANVDELSDQFDVDGGLVGGASLKPETAIPLYRTFAVKKAAQKQASSALSGHDAIVDLITTRDSGYMSAVNSTGTAKLVTLPEKGKFAGGHDVFEAVREAEQSVIAVNVVSYNQIEGHIRAAMEQNAILVLEVARSQLGYALNETKVMEYVKKAIEKIEKETGKRVPPIVVHGDHIQYTEASFKVSGILKAEYENVHGEGSFKNVDINAIDIAILENVRKKLVENTEGERKKVGEINERLIKAGFTSIAIDASTLWDEFAGDFVMGYYAKQGTAAQQLVVKLEKEFSLSVEWGSGLLKLDPATESGQAAYQIIRDELEANMLERGRSRSEIDTMLAELLAVFGVLVKEARKNGLDPQEVIEAYDQISREVAEATIAGKLSDNVMATLTDKQKLLLLPSSNAQETALQLKKINELLSQYAPELVGHFGLEVEVGHVDRKYPNPKRLDKDGKPIMEAKMTHPLAVRVMGEYLKTQGLSFDLIATNNGSAHGTDYDENLNPKSQVGKISPFLTRELQKEAASFGASIAQHGTSGSDMDELAVLLRAGVIKFNIATNYQQIILNVLSLLDSGIEGEALEKQAKADQDALMSGLHKDTRAKILSIAKEIKDNPANAELKDTDTLFVQFLKLTYQWGVGKKKIKDTFSDKDIATVIAKEFKRVFGKMDAALVGLDVTASSAMVTNGESEIDPYGGIDLGKVGVKAAPGSMAMDMAFDELARQLSASSGLSFDIIEMKALSPAGVNSILGGTLMKVENEASERNLQLASAK